MVQGHLLTTYLLKGIMWIAVAATIVTGFVIGGLTDNFWMAVVVWLTGIPGLVIFFEVISVIFLIHDELVKIKDSCPARAGIGLLRWQECVGSQ